MATQAKPVDVEKMLKGEPVGNEDILQGIQVTKETMQHPDVQGQLSAEGISISKNTERTADATARLLQEKNYGEEMQKIHASVKFITERVTDKAKSMSSSDAEAERELGAFFQGLEQLSSALVTSQSLRKQLRRLNNVFLESMASQEDEDEERFESKDSESEGQFKQEGFGLQKPSSEGEWKQDTSSDSTGKNTEHTRGNYKIILGGKEFGFLERRLTEKQLVNMTHVLQSVILAVQDDPSLKESLTNLVKFLQGVQGEMQSRFKRISDSEIERATEDIKCNVRALISRFASDHSFDELERTQAELGQKTLEDMDFRDDWNTVLGFFDKSIENSNTVRNEKWKYEMQDHIERLHRHFYDYRKIMFQLVQEIDELITDIREDQIMREFSGATKALSEELFLNEQGKICFKPQALNEFRKILTPVFEKQFQNLSMPRIAGSDEDMDYEINNMILNGAVLLPDRVGIENSSHLRVEGKKAFYQSGLHIVMENIQIEARDVQLKYTRKKFPTLSDEGKLNIKVEGGTTVQMWLSSDSRDDRVFHVDNVDCNMGTVKLYGLNFAQHEKLYYFFLPLLQFIFRKRAEKAIEEHMRDLMIQLDEKAVLKLQESVATSKPDMSI